MRSLRAGVPQPVIAEVGAAGGVVGAIALGAVAGIAAADRLDNRHAGLVVVRTGVAIVVVVVIIWPAIIGVAAECRTRCEARSGAAPAPSVMTPAATVPVAIVPAVLASVPGGRTAIPGAAGRTGGSKVRGAAERTGSGKVRGAASWSRGRKGRGATGRTRKGGASTHVHRTAAHVHSASATAHVATAAATEGETRGRTRHCQHQSKCRSGTQNLHPRHDWLHST